MVKVAIPTLGCKANRCDSDTMALILSKAGYDIVTPDTAADIYILNTCAVTGDAESKSRKYARKIIKNNPTAAVFITGCCGVFTPEIGEIAGVTAVISIKDQENILSIISAYAPLNLCENNGVLPKENVKMVRSVNRTRASLKVQDGCDHGCNYCAVTLSRGPMRSMPIADVLKEIQNLLDNGTKEIVLTGIRLDAYGIDSGTTLRALLDATVPLNIPRLRLSSVEPLGVTEELIAACAAHPTLCRHFHLCLQSGDDDVLHSMNRGYTADEFLKKVADIRSAMPNATFTTDIIVGYPGESDEAFLNTVRVAREVGFTKTHVFKFSPRKGTVAASLPQDVTAEIKNVRSKELMKLEREMFLAATEKLIGIHLNVLVETSTGGTTDGYFSVLGKFSVKDKGKILKLKAVKIDEKENIIIVEDSEKDTNK